MVSGTVVASHGKGDTASTVWHPRAYAVLRSPEIEESPHISWSDLSCKGQLSKRDDRFPGLDAQEDMSNYVEVSHE